MKKSLLFLTLFAAFAMIFASCSKDKDSNNGGNPTPTPPTGNYGTVTCNGSSFAIVAGGYTVEHDEDLDIDYVAIALVDRIDGSELTQSAIITLPYYTTVPTGQFPISIDENPEQGVSQAAVVINDNLFIATQGTTTINKNGETYTIDASGSAMSFTGTTASFTVHFAGPLVTE